MGFMQFDFSFLFNWDPSLRTVKSVKFYPSFKLISQLLELHIWWKKAQETWVRNKGQFLHKLYQ